jgi:hypothetical protein
MKRDVEDGGHGMLQAAADSTIGKTVSSRRACLARPYWVSITSYQP